MSSISMPLDVICTGASAVGSGVSTYVITPAKKANARVSNAAFVVADSPEEVRKVISAALNAFKLISDLTHRMVKLALDLTHVRDALDALDIIGDIHWMRSEKGQEERAKLSTTRAFLVGTASMIAVNAATTYTYLGKLGVISLIAEKSVAATKAVLCAKNFERLSNLAGRVTALAGSLPPDLFEKVLSRLVIVGYAGFAIDAAQKIWNEDDTNDTYFDLFKNMAKLTVKAGALLVPQYSVPLTALSIATDTLSVARFVYYKA